LILKPCGIGNASTPIEAKDSAIEIREYFVPDFSTWKDHDSYKQAFDRLLRDLKSTETGPKAIR
jgi:hypothetical protein